MPVFCGPSIVEKQGRVYRGKKRSEEEEERRALSELQSILNTRNRKVCDCEAQVHDLLENCLICGRLTCVAEGPGKCFHCSSIILSQEQRERLKKYVDINQTLQNSNNQQSQYGSKIKIVDNQFDESSIDNKRHLRETDKQKLKESLSELQSKRYQRKMVLDVDLVNLEANAISAPLIEDYNSQLRNLQLNDNQTLLSQPSTSGGGNGGGTIFTSNKKKTLAEIMDKQARDLKANAGREKNSESDRRKNIKSDRGKQTTGDKQIANSDKQNNRQAEKKANISNASKSNGPSQQNN